MSESYALVIRGSNGTEPCYMETEPRFYKSKWRAQLMAAWCILTALDYRSEVSVFPADEAGTDRDNRLYLLHDVTAGHLAMDATDGDPRAYGADDVIGPKGSTVEILDGLNRDDIEYEIDDPPYTVEVTGFLNDPDAAGFVERSWLTTTPPTILPSNEPEEAF